MNNPQTANLDLEKSAYLGNQNLRRKGTKQAWSEDQVREWIKCKNDPIYFIENYVRIVTLDHGLQLMKLRFYQKEMVQRFVDHTRNVVVLPRQSGKSTIFAAFACWYIIFHKHKTCAILAHKAATAREILGRVQLAYEHLPKWMQQGVVEWNKGSFVLENGSQVLAAATSASSIRGFTINLLFMDEVAHIPGDLFQEFFKSVYPTISSGKSSKIIMVSTPNGVNHFYDIVEKARTRQSSFVLSQYSWRDVPGYDEEWAKQQIADTSQRDFDQEFNCRFMGASNTLLDGPTVERLFQSTEAIQPVAIKYDGRFRIYEEPKEDHVYMAIVDPSEGVEQDYSAISVIDITEYPMKQIAVFRCNRTSELLLAPIAESVGRYYNDAYILVESNKGSVVLYSLNFEFEYDNLLNYRPNRQTNSNAKNQIGVSRKLGIETTKLVKRVGCSRVKEMIESRKLDIADHQTAMEFLSFIEKGNSYEADDGKTDDIVMTLVLFAFYANTPDFNEYQGKLFSREYVRDRLREIHDELLPAEMFLDDGENPYDEFSDTYEGIENMSGTERSGFLS